MFRDSLPRRTGMFGHRVVPVYYVTARGVSCRKSGVQASNEWVGCKLFIAAYSVNLLFTNILARSVITTCGAVLIAHKNYFMRNAESLKRRDEHRVSGSNATCTQASRCIALLPASLMSAFGSLLSHGGDYACLTSNFGVPRPHRSFTDRF